MSRIPSHPTTTANPHPSSTPRRSRRTRSRGTYAKLKPMKLVAPLALALCLTSISAQTFTDPANLRGERITPSNGRELPIDQNASGLAQLLRRLNTRASILNIVAHPDDEDGGMLTLYSRGLGARVADLSLTRGEGGQNAMTADFGDALGLIRTQELLSNDRYPGITQFFGTEVDFGFSKTKEESFSKWTHQRVLYDAVRAIRLFRPLLITATFIGGVTDGHGQHQVSGEIAQEAFKAAADPNVFPELTAEGILPWQALKVYARVPQGAVTRKGLFDYATNQYTPTRFTNYVTGKVTTTIPSIDVTVHEGQTDPLLTPASACDTSARPTTTNTSINSAPSTTSSTNSVTSTAHSKKSVISTGTTKKSVISTPSNKSVISTGAQRSGETCSSASSTTQLSYVQFARIGLGLQRSQITGNMRTPPAGPFDVSYHLYGSALCNAPADARSPSTTPQNCHPEQAQRAEGPATTPAAPPTSDPSGHNPQGPDSDDPISQSATNQLPRSWQPEASALGLLRSHGPSPDLGFSPQGTPPSNDPSRAPTARPITAQGNALGTTPPNSPRAVSPTQIAATDPEHASFFDGIDTSLEGIATLLNNAPGFLHDGLRVTAESISKAQHAFDPTHPEACAPSLSDALKTIDLLIKSIEPINDISAEQKQSLLHELRIKRVQLNDALVLALGLSVHSTAPSRDIVQNSSPELQTSLKESSPAPITFAQTSIEAAAQIQKQDLQTAAPKLPLNHTWQIAPAHITPITQPYFYRDNIEQAVYKLRDPSLRNAPATPSPLTAWATVNYQGTKITLGTIALHDGQPVSIVPPISIASSPKATVLPLTQPQAELTAALRTTGTTTATLNLQSPQHWTIQAKPLPAKPGSSTIDYHLHPTATLSGPQVFHLTAETPSHHTYTEGYRPVGYPGLILTNDYTPATTRIVPVDLKLPTKTRIAYLPGTGDSVPEALASLGLAPTLLTVADLTPANLARFDTVILGVRTYNAHPDLHGAPTKALLDYARAGGNVLVQFQTAEFTAADAPYPLTLGYDAEKVIDETDPVQLLTPTAPLLTTPNRITSADFNNWVEERGHSFLGTWDPHYTPLTETHDPGQLPQRGGLLTTSLGKGHWTYCAFALYRQLPEAVPGAYRLLVNLLDPTP